jgi:hypothetical protein
MRDGGGACITTGCARHRCVELQRRFNGYSRFTFEVDGEDLPSMTIAE